MTNIHLSKRAHWMKFSLMIALLIGSFTLTTISCKTTDQERQEAKIERAKQAKKRQAEKDYEKAQKRHMSIQDKKTRKRMKGNKSKMMEQTNVKKRNFWQRMFRKKDPTCPKT